MTALQTANVGFVVAMGFFNLALMNNTRVAINKKQYGWAAMNALLSISVTAQQATISIGNN
jgi:hypothetical protein